MSIWRRAGVVGGVSVAVLGLSALPAAAETASAVNTGDTAWILVSAALVMFMTPGLAFFYGGLVRSKNVLGTIMHSFMALGIVSDPLGRHRPHARLRAGHRQAYRRRRVDRRARLHRVQGRRRRAQRSGGNDSPHCVRHLPDDVRRHHAGTYRRRVRGTHQVQRVHGLHGYLGCRRLRTGCALGLGRRIPQRFGRPRRPGLRRRNGRPPERRYSGAGLRVRSRQAQGLAERSVRAAQRPLRRAGRVHPVVRLVRIQRRKRAGVRRARRACFHQHARGYGSRDLRVDYPRMVPAQEADDGRSRDGCCRRIWSR